MMDSIENRVFFFKMFRQRGFQLFSPDIDRVFEFDELPNTLFRDSSLKNNSQLVLRQPPKEEDEVDDSDEEDGAEGGEEELSDMDEEGEIEMDEPPPGYVPEDPEA